MILKLICLFLFPFAIYGFAFAPSNDESSKSSPQMALSTTNATRSFVPLLYQASTSLRRRQTSRYINTCSSLTATFVHSHCIHNPGMIGSMQSYLTFCRERESPSRTQNSPGKPTTRQIPRPTAESGRCRQNEICVNGHEPGGWGNSMALCVTKDKFSIMTLAADEGWRRAVMKGREGMGMGGLFANAVFSDDKGVTPVEVQEIDLAFVSNSSGSTNSSSSVPVKMQTCRDCFELSTSGSTPETDLLAADVMVAGTAATIGILWLAVLSG